MAGQDLVSRLEGMLASGQDSALLRFSLGTEYLRAGDAPGACAHLAKAVEQNPDYSAAWKLLGKATEAAGDIEGAARVFARGIEVAEQQGDIQAAKEMRVFLKRLQKLKAGQAQSGE